MKSKPRIAVIGLKGLPAYGGAATVGENIIDQLKDEFDFTVYSISSHTDLKSGNYKGICHQKVFKAIPFKKLNSLLYYIRAAIHAFFGSYDLVHLHHRDAAFIVPFLKLRFPIIVTTHGITGKARKWRRFKWFLDLQLKYFVKIANKVTCVSLNEKRGLKVKWGIDAEYIPNGIMDPKQNYLYIHEKVIDIPLYITFAAGRIIEFKGLDILLKALKRIENPPKLKIIGDLYQEKEYRLLIENLAKGMNVEFVGLIKEKKVLYNLIADSQLFIFPSRQEAMSIMLLEVASLKTPIIASDIVENLDIFDNNEVLFFKSENVESLSEKINWALSNNSKLSNYSQMAYDKLIKEYLWNNISKKYASIYNSLIN